MSMNAKFQPYSFNNVGGGGGDKRKGGQGTSCYISNFPLASLRGTTLNARIALIKAYSFVKIAVMIKKICNYTGAK